MTLKRKLEVGITGYLRTLTATILSKYGVHESSIADDFKLPAFVVAASGESEVFDGGAPRRVALRIYLATSIDDNEEGEVPNAETRRRLRDEHDEALSAIEAALEAPGTVATIQGRLNSGAAKRLVEDFHFYDITKTDEQPEPSDARQYKDALAFEVICQNYDG